MLIHRCDPNTSDSYLCSDQSREMSTSTFCEDNIAAMVQKAAIERKRLKQDIYEYLKPEQLQAIVICLLPKEILLAVSCSS